MKISDIIYRDEILICEVDENLEFDSVKFKIEDTSENDILFILSQQSADRLEAECVHPVAVVCEANIVLPVFFPAIRVENVREMFAKACFRFEKIDLGRMKIIGITGTNGKSTTTTMIKHILSSVGHKVGFIGTGRIEIDGKIISPENYSMTTPDPPLLYKSIKRMQESDCEYIIMEVSSHALALNKLCPLAFDIAVFTNMSEEHLDFHKNMEEYYAAKYSLLQKAKFAVINVDDKYGRMAYSTYSGRKISAGILWRGEIYASNIKDLGFDGIEYMYHAKRFYYKMRLATPGIYNAYNSMLASAVCIELGIKPCEVKQAMSTFSGVEGRYEVINDKISVIIDYAHTSFAFENILSSLFSIKKHRKITVVFGCGGNRDKAKRPKMAQIAEKYADRIILTADNSRGETTKDIISDIIQGFDKGSYEIREDRTDAIRRAIIDAKDGDIVAIIGKGPEKYNIDSRGYHYYNEKEIIMDALKERSGKN